MDITAIICEYHLLHYGHVRQIDWIRAHYPNTLVLALMSGNFVERGEAAMYSKEDRARVAVASGADLVLELPFPWSMSAGPYFAGGAVSLLAALGVTRFCFGSENGTLANLQRVADNLLSADYTAALAAARADGSFRATSDIRLGAEVYTDLFGAGFPETPNDILGVSYLVAARRTPNAPEAVTLKREGSESATAARVALRQGDAATLDTLLPPPSRALTEKPYVETTAIAPAMLAWYRLADPRAIEECADFSHGDGYRVVEVAKSATNYEMLVAGMRQKCLTDAKIRRMLWYGMLGVAQRDLAAVPAYTTLLAANARGRAALRTLHKGALPILTKRAAYKNESPVVRAQFKLALRAEALYALLADTPAHETLRHAPHFENVT